MQRARRAAPAVAGLVWVLAATGCFQVPGLRTYQPFPDLPPRLPLSAPRSQAPELRIPDQADSSRDIPIVPLPPLGRQVPSQTVAAPAPKPAVPPASSPAPAAAHPTATVVPATFRPSAPAPNGTGLRQLVQLAVQRYASMDSYIVRLTRREQVKGKNKPEEVILFKFRKEPWSLHFKWLNSECQGREVIYVKGQYENKIHTLLAAGDMPLFPAGKRMSFAVDSILVRSASRHSITEAGLGFLLDHLGQVLNGMERGDKRLGTLTDLGLQSRPEFPKPMAAVEHQIPSGAEAELPHGGRRLYFFDTESHLPVLIVTRDDQGQEVEYYRYDRLQFPVQLDDADFNPDKLWKSGANPK